ncbi:hypothetical protein JHK82_036740 [Glycine max]|nr:hypothetical protein JHK86_036939 [Glycine max]KAG5113471.1 hypothetical protein JHK82_036740 [Glycine max]KAG5130747.1 hypothetical protein JHK84_037144 [Glycine max]
MLSLSNLFSEISAQFGVSSPFGFYASSYDSGLCNEYHEIIELFSCVNETNTPAAIDSISVAEGLPSHGFHDKCNNEKSSDVNLNEQIGRIREALPNEDLKIAEQPVLELNTSISDSSMEDKRETDALELDEMKMEDDSTAAKHLLPDVIMKDKRLSEVSTASGGLRVKRRTPQGLPLFPFRRLLNPTPFKKKGKTSKSRTKLK